LFLVILLIVVNIRFYKMNRIQELKEESRMGDDVYYTRIVRGLQKQNKEIRFKNQKLQLLLKNLLENNTKLCENNNTLSERIEELEEKLNYL
jgi:signal transduction histidine kinase